MSVAVRRSQPRRNYQQESLSNKDEGREQFEADSKFAVLTGKALSNVRSVLSQATIQRRFSEPTGLLAAATCTTVFVSLSLRRPTGKALSSPNNQLSEVSILSQDWTDSLTGVRVLLAPLTLPNSNRTPAGIARRCLTRSSVDALHDLGDLGYLP